MIQFEKYPIFVVYSLHRQEAVAPLWSQYYSERQKAKENSIRRLSKLEIGEAWRFYKLAGEKDRLIDAAIEWQLLEDMDPKYRVEINEYERTIQRTLTTISHTSLGKMLLELISPVQKVWIIPADWTKPTAKTDTYTESQGGGIRIQFNPKSFRKVTVSPHRTADEVEDTLLHELVHAMRFSQRRYSAKALINKDFINTEEFIATQFENIYHSSRRASDLYSTYLGSYLTKKEMYQYFVEDAEMVPVLKYCLKNEVLAQKAAELRQPDYNPFRDIKEIEQRALKYFGITQFIEFQ